MKLGRDFPWWSNWGHPGLGGQEVNIGGRFPLASDQETVTGGGTTWEDKQDSSFGLEYSGFQAGVWGLRMLKNKQRTMVCVAVHALQGLMLGQMRSGVGKCGQAVKVMTRLGVTKGR